MAEIAAGGTAMMAAARAWSRARLYDDRLGDPDAPRLAAWAESIERWKLDTHDVVDGVCRYYEGTEHAEVIRIGDLLHHAREIRRQRAESEKAPAVAALPSGGDWEGLPIGAEGLPVWPAYDIDDAIDRECPKCQAQPGDACITANDLPQKVPCLARIKGRPIATPPPTRRR